ncbi:MAG: hypothetical protein ABIY55_26910 [Kofleriaceae bacterium]
MSREQLDSCSEARAPGSAGDASGGELAPGKRTITEMVPSTYSGPPSSGHLVPGKRTLVDSQQARTIASGPAPMQASPGAHASAAAAAGHDQPMAPAIAGINKMGFIDNSDGSFLRTGPRELGGDTVRPEKIPAATRVFVSGTHPESSSWWYVTTFLDKQMLRGYVQEGRVSTDLPEPLAELREVQGKDTAEGYAREKFGDAVTDGQDLRYYENVLLFVNQQRGRAGITGTYQDPGILGAGANNAQLVAGHRIWLVSSQYAKALQAVVPSGSLTGGAVAKVHRFVGHIKDILRSVSESRHHLDEVAGEYAQAIRDHEATIIGLVCGFIAAEAASAFLAATPTGVGQAVAMVIQLALSAFGAAGMVEAGYQALQHGSVWLTTAWNAKGKEDNIVAASKEFLKMIVAIAMAALSFLGARGNYRNLVKIGGATPTGALPAMVTAGSAVPGSAKAAAGVAIGAGPGPGGFGVGGAMMVKHEADANGGDRPKPASPETDASQAAARLETHLGKITPAAARELGRLSRLDQVLLEQLARHGAPVVEQLGALLAKVPSWPESARLGLVKLAASETPEAARIFAKIIQHPHIEGMTEWVLLASRQVKSPSQLLDLEQSLDKAIELGRFHPDVAMEVNHYRGNRVTGDQLRQERAQPGFDNRQHTNIDVETGGERWEMKRVGTVITKSETLLDQVQQGAAKYAKLGVPSLRRGGPKKNIVDVDFGDRIQLPGMDEAALRARVEKYLGRDQQISKFVDRFVLHFTADGTAIKIVVEVGQ